MATTLRNTGDDDLVFLEIFKADEYQDVSLADWISHTPPSLVEAHFRMTADTIAKFPPTDEAVRPPISRIDAHARRS